MYFSNSNSPTNFSLYKSILDKYLETKENEEVLTLFTDIIFSTYQLFTKQISESDVDHKIYNLVIALSENANNSVYFSNIDPLNIGINQFRTLSAILYSMSLAESHPIPA